MKPWKVEQCSPRQDGLYHRDLKRLKARKERHYARRMLRTGEEPMEFYGRYKGYET
jgi:hypothetical protein